MNSLERNPPPHPPLPPDWKPTENKKWFRFCVFDTDTLEAKIIDSVIVAKDGSEGVSGIYGLLKADQLEMAVDWMKQLQRNPYKRAVADRTMLH